MYMFKGNIIDVHFLLSSVTKIDMYYCMYMYMYVEMCLEHGYVPV